ncbi:MAG: hypothetical protein AAB877_00440 [Patescibacteria group bacterium]
MQNEQEVLQRHLSKFIAGEVFHTITEDDILKEANGVLYHKGQPLAPGVAEIIMKEARAFSQTGLFQILQDEMRYHAKSKHNEAKTEYDLALSNILSYFVDLFKAKVKKLAELKKPARPDVLKRTRPIPGR